MVRGMSVSLLLRHQIEIRILHLLTFLSLCQIQLASRSGTAGVRSRKGISYCRKVTASPVALTHDRVSVLEQMRATCGLNVTTAHRECACSLDRLKSAAIVCTYIRQCTACRLGDKGYLMFPYTMALQTSSHGHTMAAWPHCFFLASLPLVRS